MTEDEIIPNISKNDDYKKRYSRMSRGFWCMTIIALLLLAGLSGNYLYVQMIQKKHSDEITKNQTELIYANSQLATLTVKLQKLESIKTNDDFMIRDIELYIQTRYRRVPKIVAKSIAETIVSVAKEEQISPELIVGIMEIESQFNPMARNEKSKAIGAMQIMPEWAKKLGLKSVYDLYDIPTNISSGVKVLKIHINEDAKGDIAKGLYFYVGKDSSYAGKVFQAVGKFSVFRSTVNDERNNIPEEDDEKEETDKDAVKPAETTNGKHSS